MLSVLVVDDHVLLLTRVAEYIRGMKDVSEVYEESRPERIWEIFIRQSLDIVVFDFSSLGAADLANLGELMPQMRRVQPTCQIIMTSPYRDPFHDRQQSQLFADYWVAKITLLQDLPPIIAAIAAKTMHD